MSLRLCNRPDCHYYEEDLECENADCDLHPAHKTPSAGPVGVEPLVGASEAAPAGDADHGSQPRPVGASKPVSQRLREEKLNDEDIQELAGRLTGESAVLIAYEIRLIRSHAYSVGYRHGYADAVTDLEA